MEFTNRNGPFNLFGGICVVFIPLTIYLYGRKRTLEIKESLMESADQPSQPLS